MTKKELELDKRFLRDQVRVLQDEASKTRARIMRLRRLIERRMPGFKEALDYISEELL